MPQIFNVTANENARYKRNELELWLFCIFWGKIVVFEQKQFNLSKLAVFYRNKSNGCIHVKHSLKI